MLAPPSLFDAEFIRTLERLTLLAKRLFSGELRQRRRQRRGTSLEFEDHRKYAPGDDLRYVDWNVYQRLGQLAIKRFRAERDLILTLIVDDSASMDVGQPTKRPAALALAAALGYVGLHLFEELILVRLPFRPGDAPRGYRGVGRAFEFVTDLERHAPGGATDLAASVRTLLARHHGRGRAIVVGDFASEGGFVNAFRYLAVKGLTSDVVHLTAPDERALPAGLAGTPLMLSDPETGELLTLDVDAQTLTRYAALAAAHAERVRSAARRSRLGYHHASTDGDLERVVRGLLESGELLR